MLWSLPDCSHFGKGTLKKKRPLDMPLCGWSLWNSDYFWQVWRLKRAA
jgi:hypothetical protein